MGIPVCAVGGEASRSGSSEVREGEVGEAPCVNNDAGTSFTQYLTELLKEVGSDMAGQYDFFITLMKDSSKLVFDLSSIFSRSENINMAQKGHNADHEYIPQINMAMVFDLDRYMPVFLKPPDGSVRDVKSSRKVLDEINFHGILVLDRGFASYDMAELMSSEMKFVMPLRRNSKLIDYSMKLTSSFMYRDQGILCGLSNHDGYRIYMFQDQSLYLYYTIFVLIRAAGLADRISVKEALLKFSRVYMIMDGKKSIMSEIPASSAKLDEQLGTNIFPKRLGS